MIPGSHPRNGRLITILGPAARRKISVRHLNFFYGTQQALFDNNLDIAPIR